MKKIITILLIFCLAIGLVACSSDNSSQQTEATETQKTEVKADTTVATTAETTETSSTEAATEAATQTQANNSNAEGVELLKSVFSNLKKVDSLYVKLTVTSPEISGVEMALYRDGESTRMEMNFEGRNTVNIFNAEYGYVYSYAVGEKTGTKMKNSSSDGFADMVPDFDAEQMSEDDFEGLVTARREKLNGQDVVYIESQDFDEDLGGNVINKIWFSEKHSFFLKMESVKPDGTVAMSMDVLEIEVNKDFSKMMVPPQDIEFVSY